MQAPPTKPRHHLLSLNAWKTQLVFWFGAILVGLVTVGLTYGSEAAGAIFKQIQQQYPLLPYLLTPLGLAALAWITQRFFHGAERSGIPQIKAALDPHTHTTALLGLRIVVGKILVSLGGIFCGASVGMGGPSIHIGASLMAYMGRFAHFGPHYLERGLILAGSSAGFAAIFCAPLAGIVFAIEEMGRSLEEKTSGIILTAVILAGVTSLALLGNYAFFEHQATSLESGRAWLAIPLCGVVTGLLGGLFSQCLIQGTQWFRKIPALTPVRLALLCGIVLAILADFSQGLSTGTGYQETKQILLASESMNPWYPLTRMLANIATYFSGIPAGIFVPSISTGAGFGANLAEWFPLAPASAMILLGMVGYFSGMLQSPMTAFVLVMEMTNSHDLLLPLMATAFIASSTSRLICPVALYKALTEFYLPPPKSDTPTT